MEKLIESVEKLKKSNVKNAVDARIKEFREMQKKDKDSIFSEVCFCLMTANFNAERSIKIQEEVGKGFLDIPQTRLAVMLKDLGHRFPNKRAEFIALAREKKDELYSIIKTKSEKEIREWLADNIKGLGYKEASHFMRNIGFNNVAIIDFHIIDLLVKNNLIKEPKNLSRKNYLEIENVLKNLGDKLKLNLAELDLYLWYLETGKILK